MSRSVEMEYGIAVSNLLSRHVLSRDPRKRLLNEALLSVIGICVT
jgi:hypothetical protein